MKHLKHALSKRHGWAPLAVAKGWVELLREHLPVTYETAMWILFNNGSAKSRQKTMKILNTCQHYRLLIVENGAFGLGEET